MRFDLPANSTRIAIILATLASTAFFLARGTTSLVAGKLFPPEAGILVADKGKGDMAPGSKPVDTRAILKRNIFDSETGALWPPKAPEPTEAAADAEEVAELPPGVMPPKCEGNLKLIAAVYAESLPEWSFASLSTGSGAPMLYRNGSKVDEKEVVGIYPEAVFLKQGNGRLCSATMFTPETPAKGAATAKAAPKAKETPAASPRAKTGGISNDELDKNISKVSDTKFTVQRSLVDNILQNQAEIMRSARIVPHEQNGQVVGVKLYGIRRSSLLGKLGLQNGDLLRTINGYDMSSPDSALEAYSRLRSASNLTVAVTRRGRAMSLEYDIQQ